MSAQGMREDADADVGLDDAVGCDPHPIDTTNKLKAATTSPLRIPEPLTRGRSAGSKACGQTEVSVRVRLLARDRHREVESVRLQRQVEIRGGETGPPPAQCFSVAVALAERAQ